MTSAIFWAASLAAMLAGGYVVAVGTPCLCADVNGLMLGGGLVMILTAAPGQSRLAGINIIGALEHSVR